MQTHFPALRPLLNVGWNRLGGRTLGKKQTDASYQLIGCMVLSAAAGIPTKVGQSCYRDQLIQPMSYLGYEPSHELLDPILCEFLER